MSFEIFKKQVLKATPSDIRNWHDGPFFSHGNMRFFGDTMKSFGVFTAGGKRYLYRKPSAMINTFGKRKRAGREFATIWEIVPIDHGDGCYSVDIRATEWSYGL